MLPIAVEIGDVPVVIFTRSEHQHDVLAVALLKDYALKPIPDALQSSLIGSACVPADPFRSFRQYQEIWSLV
jgi:hypothetical protein